MDLKKFLLQVVFLTAFFATLRYLFGFESTVMAMIILLMVFVWEIMDKLDEILEKIDKGDEK